MIERDNQSSENIESKEWEVPKVCVEILFGPHATVRDLGNLKDRFEQADVYIMEAAAWTPELYRFIKDLSQGKKEPNDILQLGSIDKSSAEHVMAELEMIQGSGKPVVFIDIPYGKHAALDRYIEVVKEDNELLRLIKPDFSETLGQLRKWMEEFSQLDRDRELHMVEVFPKAIQRILDEHPHLRERKDLHVLIKLGGAHTPIVEALNNKGYKIISTVNKSYSWTDPHEEALQKKREGKVVSDDLLAKVAISILIDKAFESDIKSLSDDSIKSEALRGRLTAPLTYYEIKNIYPAIWQATTVEQLRTLFLNLFASHGVKIPTNEEELDALIVTADIN